jgi:hypothetical protein
MLSFQFYNLVHIVGLLLLVAGLAGMALAADPPPAGAAAPRPRSALVFHGLGAFLILLGGFGMLARMGIAHGASWPGWIWVKVGVWVVLGAAAFLPYRFPGTAKPLFLLVPVLGGVAAYMAIYKPL